jgi:hypothetical protein
VKPALFLCFVCASLAAQARRPFDALFPGLDQGIKAQAFSVPASSEPQSGEEKGYSRCVTNPADLAIARSPVSLLFSGPFADRVAAGDFSYISENLLVVPYAEGRTTTLLDVYNSLQKVRGMKDVKYHSFTRKKWVPLFEEASRINGPDSLKPLPDPTRLPAIPDAETLFVKLKDINLGNTIYRSELVNTGRALLYTITNHKASTLFFVTVMKRERFVSRVYLEPIEEGVLVYCVACIELSGFVERMIDVPSALKKRLDVLIEWALAGL